MHFYSPSPLSMGYIPRASYRPALVSTYLDDESSSPLAFEGLGHPAFSHSFTPRLDAETRYRRALHELQSAEEEFEAHLTLKRARQAAVLREQAERRERALAIQAEVERIERARALRAELAREYEHHQRALQAQALDRAQHQKHALLDALVDAHPRGHFISEHPFARTRLTHSRPSRLPVPHESEVPTVEDLLRSFAGVRPQPSRLPVPHDSEVPTLEGLLRSFAGIRPQPHNPPQQSGSPAPSKRRSAEPQPSERQDVGVNALNAILELIHGLAARTGDASNGSETIPEPSTTPQPQAAPVDEKGKGKAKAEPAAEPSLFQTLLGAYAQRPSDQELKDIELAIKLSLEDRNTSDAKKASVAKASRSSPGASSSKANLDGAGPSSDNPCSASDITSPTSKPTSGPVPRPVSPLTTIRAVRNQFSHLESTFKFPTVLDFDQSVLAVSPINAPLRTYENTLNGLLEQLDAIDSDGDEEVRNVRREVVREVEKALEDLERRVSEEASKLQPEVPKDVEVKGYDVQAEELDARAAQEAAPAEVTGPEPTVREPSAAIPPTDAAVDLVISEESPLTPSAAESPRPAVAKLGSDAIAQTADDGVSSLDADGTALTSEDPSDSVATITPAPTSDLTDVYVRASPAPETFLASLSHDQFTFPPRPTSSDADARSTGARDDTVLVDNSEEGESVKSGEDGWSEVDA